MIIIVHGVLNIKSTGGSSVFRHEPQPNLDFELITPDAVKIHDSNSPPKIILQNKR